MKITDIYINNKKISNLSKRTSMDNPKDKYITITDNKEEYKNIILPYINNIYKANTKWIFDILQKNGIKKFIK